MWEILGKFFAFCFVFSFVMIVSLVLYDMYKDLILCWKAIQCGDRESIIKAKIIIDKRFELD